MIPDSYRSTLQTIYPNHPMHSDRSAHWLVARDRSGIVAPPLRGRFRSWLRHRRRGSPCIWPRVEFNIVLFMDGSSLTVLSLRPLQRRSYPSATDRPVGPSGRDSPFCGGTLGAHRGRVQSRLGPSLRTGTAQFWDPALQGGYFREDQPSIPVLKVRFSRCVSRYRGGQ